MGSVRGNSRDINLIVISMVGWKLFRVTPPIRPIALVALTQKPWGPQVYSGTEHQLNLYEPLNKLESGFLYIYKQFNLSVTTTRMSGPVLTSSSIEGLPKIAEGKVRDLYEVDEKTLLFVASDRISAYDVIMKNVQYPALQYIIQLLILCLGCPI